MAASSRVSLKVADAILGHQIDLFRVEAGARQRVLRLVNQLQADLSAQLSSGGDLTQYSKDRLRALLRQATESIDDYYARVQGQLEPTLQAVARAQAAHVAEVLVSAGGALPTETFFERLAGNLLVQGAPSAEWWKRQAKNVAFKFANAVRSGMAAGQTNEQIVRSVAGSARLGIPGIMNIARSDARSLVHASVQTAANASRMESFRANSDVVKGVRQLSTFDTHTTETCIAYDGQEWDLDGNALEGSTLPFVSADGSADGVPRHWGCRSVLVPITATFKELGLDEEELKPAERARSGGAGGMDEWMARRTGAQLDDLLGPGRADLYRRGVITREQLLDLTGRPLSLAQLRQKYA